MCRIIVAAALSAVSVFFAAEGDAATIGGCKFNTATHQFRGTLSEQAKCLLRKVKPKGAGATVQPIPDWLNAHMGAEVTFTKAKLETYLHDKGIDAADVAVDSQSA